MNVILKLVTLMHGKCFFSVIKSVECIFRAIFDFWCLLVVANNNFQYKL